VPNVVYASAYQSRIFLRLIPDGVSVRVEFNSDLVDEALRCSMSDVFFRLVSGVIYCNVSSQPCEHFAVLVGLKGLLLGGQSNEVN